MNKFLVYLVILVLFSAGAAAMGIGAKNIEIEPQGQKQVELFIINDEHKDIIVQIDAMGNSEGIEITPDEVNIDEETYLKKFTVSLDFEKINSYPVKIVASASGSGEGQISAVANIIYVLPIARHAFAEEKKQKAKTESDGVNEEGMISPEMAEPDLKSITGKFETKKAGEISSAATEETKTEEREIGAGEGKNRNAAILFILAAITLFLAINASVKRKTPLERFVIKSRRNGKEDDEIRKILKEEGWSDLIIEHNLKK